jgi:hypothetical protein
MRVEVTGLTGTIDSRCDTRRGNAQSGCVYWTRSSRKLGIYRKGVCIHVTEGGVSTDPGLQISDISESLIFYIWICSSEERCTIIEGIEEPHPNRKLGYPLIHHPAPTP